MKSVHDRYYEIKLDILHSLARSQKALAVILESVADVSAENRGMSDHLLEHLDVLAKYQMALAGKLGGLRLAPGTASGPPGPPWLNRGAGVSSGFSDCRRLLS